MPTYIELEKAIREKNYISLPFPLSRADFVDAAGKFIDFLSLDEDVKEVFNFRIAPPRLGGRVGYVRKKQELGQLDNKEYFHYHPSIKETYPHMYQNETVRRFLETAEHIHAEATILMREIISTIDTAHPGVLEKFYGMNGTYSVLRFLKYDVSGKGKFLAKAHYDQGGCTLALAESAPGLRIGRGPETLREVRHRDGEVLFFPAVKLADVAPEFYPAWHDVVQKEEDQATGDMARWAIVYFANTNDSRPIPHEETHTPREQTAY